MIELFVTFLLVGAVSFGGGYAMIPLIQEEVLNRHQWMSAAELADAVAMAGMSPGPIAANIAAAVGYRAAGLPGAVVASAAVVLPSLAIILAIGKIFSRFKEHELVKSSLYGLRPVVAGMIVYAAILFAQHAGMTFTPNWFSWSQIVIFAGSLVALTLLHKHPFSVLILSGLVGIAVYG